MSEYELTDEQADFLSQIDKGPPHPLLIDCDCPNCKVARPLVRAGYLKLVDDYCHLTLTGSYELAVWRADQSKETINFTNNFDLTDEQAGWLIDVGIFPGYDISNPCPCLMCNKIKELYRLGLIHPTGITPAFGLTAKGVKALGKWELDQIKEPVNIELAKHIYLTGFDEGFWRKRCAPKKTISDKEISDLIQTWNEEQDYIKELQKDNPSWRDISVTINKGCTSIRVGRFEKEVT